MDLERESARQLRRRRQRFLAAWRASSPTGELPWLLVPAGVPVSVEGTDAHYRFRGSDAHRSLCGSIGPARVLVVAPDGSDVLYVPRASVHDAVWHGPEEPLETLGRETGVGAVRPLVELEAALVGMQAAAAIGATDLFERPGAYGVHPGVFDHLAFDLEATTAAEAALVGVRLAKDPLEIALLERAIAASVAAHEVLRSGPLVGRTERELAAAFAFEAARAGGEALAYPSIVLAGRRAAILHGAPSDRRVMAGDLVLVDAAAECAGYDADLTRTFPADAASAPAEARALHDLVREAQERAVSSVRPGLETVQLHLATCRTLVEGLVDLGLLRGNVDDLVADDVHTVFFPHGIGHPLGLATHDVGGFLPDRPRATRPTLRWLRMDRPLVENMVVTIEPGIYFIDALLDDADTRRRFAGRIDFERVERFRPLGGIRIEDDVLVTADSHRVLGPPLSRAFAG